MFRTLWRFMPLLVIVTAWFLNRQAEDASMPAEVEAKPQRHKVSA